MSYEEIELKFTSGNSINVERATVLASEWKAVKQEIAELKAAPKTIWCAANKVSSLYFESEEEAKKYASSFPATVHIEVFGVEVLRKANNET